jgi:hypothetical protein
MAGGGAGTAALLFTPFERKNCWTIAEHAGHDPLNRLQHLLRRHE